MSLTYLVLLFLSLLTHASPLETSLLELHIPSPHNRLLIIPQPKQSTLHDLTDTEFNAFFDRLDRNRFNPWPLNAWTNKNDGFLFCRIYHPVPLESIPRLIEQLEKPDERFPLHRVQGNPTSREWALELAKTCTMDYGPRICRPSLRKDGCPAVIAEYGNAAVKLYGEVDVECWRVAQVVGAMLSVRNCKVVLEGREVVGASVPLTNGAREAGVSKWGAIVVQMRRFRLNKCEWREEEWDQ